MPKEIKHLLNSLFAFVGAKIDALQGAVVFAIGKISKPDFSELISHLEEQHGVTREESERIASAIDKHSKEQVVALRASLQDVKVSIEALAFGTQEPVDLSEIKTTLDVIARAIPKVEKTDIAPILKELSHQTKSLKNILQKDNKVIVPKTDVSDLPKILKSLSVIKDILKDNNISVLEKPLKDVLKKKEKNEIKINTQQFKELLGNLRHGGTIMSSAALTAQNVTLANVSLTATDTEYSYTFPANTLSWTIKLRDQGTLAYYSFATGTLPTVGGGGDGSLYATIPQNFLQSQAGVEWSGKVIYLGAESASQVAEITSYQA